MHPLPHLVVERPQLLADHAQAYAALAGGEFTRACTAWKRQALWNAVALCGLSVAAVLAGVALMLWAVVPAAHLQTPWALVCAPLPPLLLGLACLAAARSTADADALIGVRTQWRADLAMLRETRAL